MFNSELNTPAAELEERIKSVRVLPLATIFHMFPRMVRDIAREKNKGAEEGLEFLKELGR